MATKKQRVPGYTEALTASLKMLETDQIDDGVRRLAVGIAMDLDEGKTRVSTVAAAYLQVLAHLGLTPAARKAAMKGKEVPSTHEPVDELGKLRAQHAARANSA